MPILTSSAVRRSSGPSVSVASPTCSYAWMMRGCSEANWRYAEGSFFSMHAVYHRAPPQRRRLLDAPCTAALSVRSMSADDRVKWDARYRSAGALAREPSTFLRSLDALLPRPSAATRVLDVAGGDGRNAVWLARRGYGVTVADVSPVGLDLARASAAAAGV